MFFEIKDDLEKDDDFEKCTEATGRRGFCFVWRFRCLSCDRDSARLTARAPGYEFGKQPWANRQVRVNDFNPTNWQPMLPVRVLIPDLRGFLLDRSVNGSTPLGS